MTRSASITHRVDAEVLKGFGEVGRVLWRWFFAHEAQHLHAALHNCLGFLRALHVLHAPHASTGSELHFGMD